MFGTVLVGINGGSGASGEDPDDADDEEKLDGGEARFPHSKNYKLKTTN